LRKVKKNHQGNLSLRAEIMHKLAAFFNNLSFSNNLAFVFVFLRDLNDFSFLGKIRGKYFFDLAKIGSQIESLDRLLNKISL
jgi:hypothetical protein